MKPQGYVQKRLQVSLHQLLWYLSSPCLLLHQLLQLWGGDPSYPGPSALAVETQWASETIYVDPDVPEPALKGDIQMEYSSD